MEDVSILTILQSFSLGGGIALAALVFSPVGKAIASRLTKNGNGDKRIDELLAFKEESEQNHFHDLAELKEEVKNLRNEMQDTRERLIRLETKINGNGRH